MPFDLYILEYKYLKNQTSKLYEGLNQNKQTNLLLYDLWRNMGWLTLSFI